MVLYQSTRLAFIIIAAVTIEVSDAVQLRAINRSRHAGDHSTYLQQRSRIQSAVGNYTFYVYEGGAFDAITTKLLAGHDNLQEVYRRAEQTAEVWVHRALLANARRTRNPATAKLFFVPAYLTFSSKVKGHAQRVDDLIDALQASPWFRRKGGRDHVFGYSSFNPGVATSLLFPKISAAMNASWFGCFEVNPAWVGGGVSLDHMIPMPYVVNAETFVGPSDDRAAPGNTKMHHHEISVFFAANARKNAIAWANCDRGKALGLLNVSKSLIHIPGVGGQPLVQETFARSMRVADFCLVMCGDTPTSRRIFDSIVANCIPLIVGTRLWGRCEPPCRAGWGWTVSGPENPHLPFQSTLIDYTRFPRVDEAALYVDAAAAYDRAVAGVSESYQHDVWSYLNAIREDVVYGYGSFWNSTTFGRSASNLMDEVILRLLHDGRVPEALRPESHNPIR